MWAKSQTQGDIIARSGTTFKQTSREGSMAEALDDAENRLRSGGGLLSKQGGINLLDMGNTGNENRSSSLVINPINPYLWRATLETINFMPIASADPFGGIIITDWYNDTSNNDDAIKLTIRFLSNEVQSNSLRIIVHRKRCTTDTNCLVKKIESKIEEELRRSILTKAAVIKKEQEQEKKKKK